jgi:hypothetical protein
MSGGGGIGPRALAALIWASNSAATSVGMLPRQARSISTMRSFSATRRARSVSDRFVIVPRVLSGWTHLGPLGRAALSL